MGLPTAPVSRTVGKLQRSGARGGDINVWSQNTNNISLERISFILTLPCLLLIPYETKSYIF